MIEILVIWFVSGAFAKRAIAKGRPSWQGRARHRRLVRR
jgi:hypothetical protein